MIVWNGRLCGATMFGLFGSSENAEPRLCSTKPYGAHGGAAAVDAEDAVNQRHHVAPAIGGGQIDRAAVGAAC